MEIKEELIEQLTEREKREEALIASGLSYGFDQNYWTKIVRGEENLDITSQFLAFKKEYAQASATGMTIQECANRMCTTPMILNNPELGYLFTKYLLDFEIDPAFPPEELNRCFYNAVVNLNKEVEREKAEKRKAAEDELIEVGISYGFDPIEWEKDVRKERNLDNIKLFFEIRDEFSNTTPEEMGIEALARKLYLRAITSEIPNSTGYISYYLGKYGINEFFPSAELGRLCNREDTKLHDTIKYKWEKVLAHCYEVDVREAEYYKKDWFLNRKKWPELMLFLRIVENVQENQDQRDILDQQAETVSKLPLESQKIIIEILKTYTNCSERFVTRLYALTNKELTAAEKEELHLSDHSHFEPCIDYPAESPFLNCWIHHKIYRPSWEERLNMVGGTLNIPNGYFSGSGADLFKMAYEAYQQSHMDNATKEFNEYFDQIFSQTKKYNPEQATTFGM